MTKQKYKKLNLLLDSDVSFTQQEIKDELGIHVLPNQLSTFKMFMLNFAEYREAIAFSAGNNRYPPHNFNIHDLTYSKAQGVYKRLDKANLATFFKGKPRGRAVKAELSRLRPSKKLLNWLDEKLPYSDSIYLNPQCHVRLRNDNDKETAYRPTLFTEHLEMVMTNYHQKLNEWGYSLDRVAMDKLHMYINFRLFDNDSSGNPNIRYGGRWWGEHNQLPSKDRVNRISFENVEGGDDLVELDFKSAILTALRYWELGREPEKDHYELFRHDEYVDRQHIKNLTQMMLNRKRKNLKEAYQRRFYTNKEGKPKKNLSLKQKVELHWLYDTAGRFIAKMHSDIGHWFLRGKRIGQLASFVESNLMLEIVRRCCNENIAVLTAFDSFIVPKKHQKRVYQLMYEEDVFPFVKELINKDEQDSVERISKGHVDWNSLNVKSHIKLAKTHDLTLIDTSYKTQYFLFRFDKCGHEKELNTGNLKRKKPRCDECVYEERLKDAEAIGLILLGRIDHRTGKYKYKKCGHERTIAYLEVREGNVSKCHECRMNKVKKVAKSNGLTLVKQLPPDGRNSYYECIIDSCGHTVIIGLPQLKTHGAICHTCIEDKHRREAQEAGLILLGEGSDSSRRTYKRIECGHTLELLVNGQVRRKHFVCHDCEETALDLPSKVYLLKLKHKDLTWLKLGYSKNIKQRIAEYQLADGIEIERLKTINMDTGREALFYEKELHRQFRKSKLNKTKMQKYMQFGFDECYKLEALDKLLEELESG